MSGSFIMCPSLMGVASFGLQKTVVYDAHYALRLCLEHHLNEACVHIYSAMGLYEEALDLALVLVGVWQCCHSDVILFTPRQKWSLQRI